MLKMREIMNVMDSYTDDSNSVDSKRLSQNINLDIGGFAKENDQLSHAYKIGDTQFANSRGTEIIKAIKEYTAGSEINGALIEAGGDSFELPYHLRKQYTMLMSLKGKVGLPEEHHTYSGTGTFNPMDVTVDGVFKTPAFLSTSLSIKVAVKTTNYRRDEDEDHVLHFVLPEGFSGGYYIAPYSEDPEELEFLIFPKEEFHHVKSAVMILGGVKRHIHTFRPS